MMLTMYAIKDELNGFTTPIPFLSEELAKRYMRDQYEGNPTIKNSPKDFSIWQIGFFNTETAEFEQIEKKLIERVENYA